MRYGKRIKPEAVLCAFDLLELDGEDLRDRPFEARKRTLARLIQHAGPGIQLSGHLHGNGADIFRHACMLGCEGIVSKRVGSPYASGRTEHRLKSKNPNAPAVKRELDEDWHSGRRRT